MTRSSIESKLKKELVNMKGFKVLETLHIMFIKERYDNNQEEDRSEFTDAYFNSKAYTIMNEMNIEKETKLSIADIKAVTSCSTHKTDQQETDGQNSKIRQSRSQNKTVNPTY